MKTIIVYLSVAGMLILCGCKKDDSMTPAGPVTMYLIGRWQLDKIVTPTRTQTAAQLGYIERIEIGNDGSGDFDRIQRDNLPAVTYYWSRDPWPVASAKNMTALVTYVNGKKRFFRINGITPGASSLETSAYLPEIGTTADTITYYYSSVR